jgi:hypothetical protein
MRYAWLCFDCVRSLYHIDAEQMTMCRATYRRAYNQRAFAHIIRVLRTDLSARVEHVNCLREFMRCMDEGQIVPWRILSGVNAYIRKHSSPCGGRVEDVPLK